MVCVICKECKNTFDIHQAEINRGNGKFCSSKCSAKFYGYLRKKPKTPNVKCAHCGCEFYKQPSKMKNSKSGIFFCCREHKDLSQRIGGIKEIMPSHYANGDGRHYRKIALSQKPMECERCGYNKHPAGIVVHHKDRDRTNNSIENLEVLCAICHNIEHYDESVEAMGFEPTRSSLQEKIVTQLPPPVGA